jgi:hypothetical protein
MKQTSNQIVRDSYSARIAAGYNVDSRLMREVERGRIFSFTFEDVESFLSLIWQEIDDTRLLTPSGQPRTLRDVAERVLKSGHSLEKLASDLGFPINQHKPAWFKKCVPIAQNFSYESFGFVATVPATDSERRQSPNGSFYIYDGIHKTLVLSILLVSQQIIYDPIQAILLIPRR